MISVKEFFDKDTCTVTYCVWDPNSLDAVVIDPVLNYDVFSSKVTTQSVEEVALFIREQKLRLHFIFETHVHADHMSGATELKQRLETPEIAINEHIRKVQETFSKIYNLSVAKDGSQFDLLLKDGEQVKAGKIEIQVRATPGHTPACVSYLIEDAVFTGDVLFLPEAGVGRCDFPNGSAEQLFDSVTQRLFTLPDNTRVFPAHDYREEKGASKCESSIGEEKIANIHLKAETAKNDFVKFRNERDKTLKAPRLLFPSIQVNIQAGRLPAPESNGSRYLKIPLG